MKYLVFPGMLILSASLLWAQDYYGMESSELVALMKKEHPEFLWQDQVRNDRFRYLKFVDVRDSRTWLFFLDEDDRCWVIRLMHDYTYLDQTLEWLNERFTEAGPDRWVGRQDNGTLEVEMVRGEWFFTVTMKEKEQLRKQRCGNE